MVIRLSLIFAVLVLAIAAYSSLTVRAGSGHSQNVTKKFRKSIGKYRVELTEVDEQPASGAYWGAFDDDQHVKNTYVDDLSVWYKGTEIDEPMSCYTDLANVNSMTVTPVPNGLVINIEGGDASVAYKTQIVVKGDQIVQRAVHDGEFPDNDWEKTQYHVEPPK